MKTLLLPIAAFAALVALNSSAHAQTLLKVDINGAGGPNQTGFTDQAGAGNSPLNATYTGMNATYITSGNVTLNIYAGDLTPLTGWDNSRDRGAVTGSGNFTSSDLYRDFIFRNASAASSSLVTTFSNLNASTAYQFTFYSYDKNNSNGNVWTQTFTAPGASGFISWGTGAPSTNSQYAVTITATTDNTGSIVWTQASSGSGNTFTVLNGFEIAAVPEPSTWALLAVSLTTVMVLRRRRLS